MNSLEAMRLMLDRAGLTPYRVSILLGRKSSYVSGMLRRGSVPSADLFAEIAKVCGYQMELMPLEGFEAIKIDPSDSDEQLIVRREEDSRSTFSDTDCLIASKLQANNRMIGAKMTRWVDYEPYADRSVAEFRAKREMCGISLYDIAQELGVAVNTVKRWENPNYFPPSPEAWRYIDRQYSNHRNRVADALRKALDNRVEDQPIVIPWYRNGMRGASDMLVGVNNAVSRSVAESLMAFGYKVIFRWSDPDAEEAQREATSSFYRRVDQSLNE